ncbi:EAL domain-containing protein [Colwellia sp. C1TZA3]|uniref:EAL domain-containing protein n=1 Tax=Colwellia sp. C1TZA3 TaxID=2508879 RepID=UPI00174EAACC|nr:EAL domain-containing protein [Colwellia sp. C1TZA3]
MIFSEFSKRISTALITIILLAIVASFVGLIYNIDQKNISELNSDFTINSSYYIDETDSIDLNHILSNVDFIASKLNNIPYALAQQSYWIKLSLHYPIDKTSVTASAQESFIKDSGNKQLILMAEHSMLDTFIVYQLNALTAPKKVFHKRPNSKNLSQNVYPYARLQLNQFGHSEYLIKVKNSGPPNIPLQLFTPQDFEQRVLLSQLIYGAFIGILIIMAIYNLVLFFADKDKVYLFYIGYLLSAFSVLSSLTGYGYFLFSNQVMQLLNKYLIFTDFLLIIFLLLFTLYFLRYDRLKHWAYKYSIIFTVIIGLFSLYSLSLDELTQTKLFFSLQPLFYIVALFLIFNRLKHDFLWARFYFLSWLPLLVGAIIQPMVLLNQLEYSFLTGNAFLFAIMIEVTFMAFALAERIRRNEQEKLTMVAYHQSNHLPRQTNLDHKISQLIEEGKQDFTVVVIKPEQFHRIELYIDEQIRVQFFQHLNLKLSSLFRFNDAVLNITEQFEKLCYLENSSLAIVIDNSLNEQDIALFVNSIQQAARDVFYIKDLKLPLSAHVGLAHFSAHDNVSTNMINNASIAANKAELTQNKWAYFTQKDNQSSPSSIQLAIDLQQAITAQGFELFHQPQIDLKTNKVCGSECLIRWQHPTLGHVSPDVFIPVAEDFGLIPSLTLWVVETALSQQSGLTQHTGMNHMVSINISGKDLIQANFIEDITKIINHSDIKAEKIIFELTESVSFAQNSLAIETIENLIGLGITISLDDFGTGYASMSQINQLPFQELKVDREFVEDVCSNNKRKVIAETAVKMAKGLGLEVVAEGINSSLDEETLRSFGCDIGQGYYYAKPMSYEDYLSWLNHLSNGQIPASLAGEYIPAPLKDTELYKPIKD